ncbi:hypothetical protein OEZ86_003655 [Tetradesmus obliquus]|nr:hypothetical protein OEZ86_003655 [Tetradesmus obliquus]
MQLDISTYRSVAAGRRAGGAAGTTLQQQNYCFVSPTLSSLLQARTTPLSTTGLSSMTPRSTGVRLAAWLVLMLAATVCSCEQKAALE